MVDRLKDSLAGLEAPACLRCRVQMRWLMSKLMGRAQAATIVHRFVCPSCEGIEEIEAEFKPIHVPPDGQAKARPAARAA